MPQYGWRYSFARCIGCRACVVACRMEQNWPETAKYRWVVDIESGSFPNVTRTHFSSACYHCEDPACMAACTNIGADAITKNPAFGNVVIDQDLCIGCRHCISACPYGAAQWNEETNTVIKCDLCQHRLEAGMNPACVDTCVGEALTIFQPSSGSANTETAESLGFDDPAMTEPNVDFD